MQGECYFAGDRGIGTDEAEGWGVLVGTDG